MFQKHSCGLLSLTFLRASAPTRWLTHSRRILRRVESLFPDVKFSNQGKHLSAIGQCHLKDNRSRDHSCFAPILILSLNDPMLIFFYQSSAPIISRTFIHLLVVGARATHLRRDNLIDNRHQIIDNHRQINSWPANRTGKIEMRRRF